MGELCTLFKLRHFLLTKNNIKTALLNLKSTTNITQVPCLSTTRPFLPTSIFFTNCVKYFLFHLWRRSVSSNLRRRQVSLVFIKKLAFLWFTRVPFQKFAALSHIVCFELNFLASQNWKLYLYRV